MPCHPIRILAVLAALVPMSLRADPALVDRIVRDIRAGGCVVTDAGSETLVDALGADDDAVEQAMETLLIDGFATFDTTAVTMTLIPALCDPMGQGNMRAALTAILRIHGCQMTERQADGVLVAHGLTQDATRPTAQAMLAAGDLVDDGPAVALSQPLCEGTGDAAPSPWGAALRALRAGGCALPHDDLTAALASGGTDPAMARRILHRLVAAGRLGDDGVSFTLPAPACGGLDAPATQPTVESDAFVIDGIMRRNGCAVPLADTGALDSRLVAPFAAALGQGFGVDHAADDALRMRVADALAALRGAGKVAWDGATGVARLLACP